ncbi:MAG: phospholipase D-like domain-containing protein [Polyangiaceae bacterium]
MNIYVASYLASHAVALFVVVVWLLMLTRISGTMRTPQSTLAWLLGFAFVPLLAIPLYLAFGTRKFPRRAKGRQLDVPPLRAGNSFELLTTGESAYARLLSLVHDATRSIDLSMFIVGDDEVGRAVIAALAERAKRGVAVRVIVDAVGSMRMYGAMTRALRPAGAHVRVFMPLRHSPVRGRTNLRSHRKVLVVDGETVFAGGMNLALEYMGPPRDETTSPRWRDVMAIVRGPVAADAAALFESDWIYCGGTARRDGDAREAAAIASEGDAHVRFVPSGPDMTTDTMYDLFLNGIFGARERIAIVTPYYVPDDALQHALVLAARRGIRTEVLVPAVSNHRIADVARRHLLRELAANGVRLHFYTKGMVHAKAMVIDDAFAYVGSPNFDMRSLFLNYEDALCVYSSDAIALVRAFVDTLISECGSERPVFPEHRILEQIALLMAPEL